MSREQQCYKCHKIVEINGRAVGVVYTDNGHYLCEDCWEELMELEERYSM